MRPRTVLVLLALVVVLVAFIWIFERELPSTEERAELAKKVLALEREEISKILVVRDGQRVELVRSQTFDTSSEDQEARSDSDEWRIVHPLEARADQAMVGDLLVSLTSLEKSRTVTDVDRGSSGLETPRARVVLSTPAGEVVLLVGSDLPASGSMLVATDDDRVAHVVDSGLWTDLEREPGEWRSREVFAWRRDDIGRMTLQSEKHRVELVRRDDGYWIESPFEDRAHDDRVQDLLSDLTGLRVAEFVDDPGRSLSSLGLQPPMGSVDITLSDREEPWTLSWGGEVTAESGRHNALAEGQLFETDSDLGDALTRSVEDWRSLALTSFETYQIDEVKVSDRAAGEMTLVRSGADWKRNGDEIPFTTVSDLLYALTEVEAGSVTSEAELRERGIELTEPEVEVEIQGSERAETVSLFGVTGEGVPATVSDRGIVALVTQEKVEEVLEKLAEIRSAERQDGPAQEEGIQGAEELSTDQQD